MSTTMKISLLALASSVVAHPQYGYGHSKFHSMKPSGTEGYGYPQGQETAPAYSHGTGKPYPTSAYPMGNSTHHQHPTGSYAQGQTSVVDVTSTSTKTIVKTVHVSGSPASGNYPTSPAAVAQAVSTGGYEQCGPATVTVTASEKVTVTVGGGYDMGSSAPPTKPSSAYVAPPQSSAYVAVPPQSSAYVAAPPSSAPVAASSKPAQGGYSASAPQPVKPTSSKVVVPVYSSAAPSSAAPSASAPATGSYSGAKRGLAYNDASLLSTFSGKYGFAYNWGQTSGNIDYPFIPMMHKPSDSSAEAWLANVDTAVKKGSTAVFGFNECDISSQCNLSPQDACTAWKSYMNPVKAKYPNLVVTGPSVSNGPSSQGMGLDWLTRFNTACPDAVFDATVIHFYDNYDSGVFDRFKSQVEAAIALNNKPVYIPEFGLNPGATEDQAASFLKQCISYLDSNDNVHGYSWFMVGSGDNQLCSGAGLSPVGQAYTAGM